METLTKANKVAMLRALASTIVDKSTTSFCGCCGACNVSYYKREYHKPNATPEQLYKGGGGIDRFGNRIYYTFTEPQEVQEITNGFEGLVIPDETGNLTLEWKDE